MSGTNFGNVSPDPSSCSNREVLRFDDGSLLDVIEVHRGGMGLVRIGRFSGADLLIAAKSFRPEWFFDSAARVAFLRETSVWLRLSACPFVLPLIGVKKADNLSQLLMPAVERNERGEVSLRDVVNNQPRGVGPGLTLEVAFAIVNALFRGAKVVPDLVHGDVKPDNILLLGGVPHLADFGISTSANASAPGGRLAGS